MERQEDTSTIKRKENMSSEEISDPSKETSKRHKQLKQLTKEGQSLKESIVNLLNDGISCDDEFRLNQEGIIIEYTKPLGFRVDVNESFMVARFLEFFRERCFVISDSKIRSKKLHDAYIDWMINHFPSELRITKYLMTKTLLDTYKIKKLAKKYTEDEFSFYEGVKLRD